MKSAPFLTPFLALVFLFSSCALFTKPSGEVIDEAKLARIERVVEVGSQLAVYEAIKQKPALQPAFLVAALAIEAVTNGQDLSPASLTNIIHAKLIDAGYGQYVTLVDMVLLLVTDTYSQFYVQNWKEGIDKNTVFVSFLKAANRGITSAIKIHNSGNVPVSASLHKNPLEELRKSDLKL